TDHGVTGLGSHISDLRIQISDFTSPVGGVEQFLNELNAGGNDLAGGGEAGRGDDHVGELGREIDVTLLQGGAADHASAGLAGSANLRRAAVGGGLVQVATFVGQPLGVGERGDGYLAKG